MTQKKKSIIGLILNAVAAICCFLCCLNNLFKGDAFDFWLFLILCVGNMTAFGTEICRLTDQEKEEE